MRMLTTTQFVMLMIPMLKTKPIFMNPRKEGESEKVCYLVDGFIHCGP